MHVGIIEAGAAVVDQINLETTAEQLALLTGYPVATFKAEFPSIEAFFEALQRRFLDGRLNRVISEAGHLPAGMGRVRAAWSGYLDYTLEQASIFNLCRQARNTYPKMRNEVRKRNGTVPQLLNTELVALKVESPMVIAKLVSSMVFELAKLECEERRVESLGREAVWSFIESRIG